MAAPPRTMSGSRFLRPKLSRFFNQVAQAWQRISRFVKAAPALMPPPLPDVHASQFLAKPPPPPAEALTTPRPPGQSRFLPPKTLSRFFNEVAHPRLRTSGSMKGAAALQLPMPDIFSSKFFKPRKPRSRPRPNWPPGKPRGPGL